MKRKEPLKLKRPPKGWTILLNPEDYKPTRAPFKVARVNKDWWQEMILPIYKNTDWEAEIIEKQRKLGEEIEATIGKYGNNNEKGLRLVQKAIQRQKDWAQKYISFFGSHDRAVDFELFHARLKELEKTLGFGQQYQWEQFFELQNSLNSSDQGITISRWTPDNEPKEVVPRPNEVDPDKEGREDSKPETQSNDGLWEKFFEWLRGGRSKENLCILFCGITGYDFKNELKLNGYDFMTEKTGLKKLDGIKSNAGIVSDLVKDNAALDRIGEYLINYEGGGKGVTERTVIRLLRKLETSPLKKNKGYLIKINNLLSS